MKKELEEKIINECPLLLRKECRSNVPHYGFECGDGWFQLLYDASIAIEAEIRRTPLDHQERYYAIQVKEKLGRLRYYMNSSNSQIQEIISNAERVAAITCETCGSPGVLGSTGSWLSTACGEKCGGRRWKPTT